MAQRRGHHVGVLQRQIVVAEQHLDGGGDLRRVEIVDRRQHPGGLGQHEVRHPGSLRDERLRGCDLPRVVACDEADENIGVNGSHAVL